MTGFSFVNDEFPATNITIKPIYHDYESLLKISKETHSNKCKFPDTTTENATWTSEGFPENQHAVSHDLIIFIDRFYELFPELLKVKLYLAGESYAGKYIPSLATRIDQLNKHGNRSFIIPLVKLLIYVRLEYQLGMD
jgi:hypothetical protein